MAAGDDPFDGMSDGRLTRLERAAWDGMRYAGGGRIERGDRVRFAGGGPVLEVIGYDLLRNRVLLLGPAGTALAPAEDVERAGEP